MASVLLVVNSLVLQRRVDISAAVFASDGWGERRKVVEPRRWHGVERGSNIESDERANDPSR